MITKDEFQLLCGGHRIIAFNRIYVTITESVATGLFLSQACFYQERAGDDAWWEKTQDAWTVETGLSRYEQETARKTLKGKKILQETRRGTHGYLSYRINMNALLDAVNSLVEKSVRKSALINAKIRTVTIRNRRSPKTLPTPHICKEIVLEL